MFAASGTVALIYAIIMLTLGVLWFLLPFAVFGMKPKLDAMLVEMRKANALLESMARQQAELLQQQKMARAREVGPPVDGRRNDS
jgi:ABC-type uncharacterized transport system permease subunit